MLFQRTLKQAVSTTGVGLHTGAKVKLTARPAPENTGIVFRRADQPSGADLPAKAELVKDTRLSSCLVVGDTRLSTVEHFMAALSGLLIDNAIIDVEGPEIPIMDGSSAPFVFLLESAGIETQKAARRYLRMKEIVEVREGDKLARLAPHDGFLMDFTMHFDHPVLTESNQRVIVDYSRVSFNEFVARARTFCFTRDVEAMRGANLALGGNLGNAVVLDEYSVLNKEGFRFDDELVRHKVLDAVGDLYLCGHSIIGAFTAVKSGHALNNALVRALLAQPEAYEVVSFAHEAELPGAFLRWTETRYA